MYFFKLTKVENESLRNKNRQLTHRVGGLTREVEDCQNQINLLESLKTKVSHVTHPSNDSHAMQRKVDKFFQNILKFDKNL